MHESADRILQLLRTSERALNLADIASRLDSDRGGRRRIQSVLTDLVAAGKVRRLPGNRYRTGLAPTAALLGTLIPHPDGYGFVRVGDGDDVFIPARAMGGGFPGDQVAVEVSVSGRTGRREGRVVRIVERVVKRVAGLFQVGRKAARLIPEDNRIGRDILIPATAYGGARDGQVVVAEITSYPDERNPAVGVVVEILGWPDDPAVEQAIIIEKYGLPVQFPAACLREAQRVARTIDPADTVGREDLRQLQVVTIDGESAKDFDDAVAVRREAGGIRLWVSIADVAHYVAPDSALDQEAYLRGTSVYFPGRCLPMLPEELSNGICSLNPGVDRLTMTAELLIAPSGEAIEERFYPSLIRSAARLTYTLVTRILAAQDEAVRAAHAPMVSDLELMAELAGWLQARRARRGSLDFDLPEPEFVLDLQGETEAIVRSERTVAHRIIEEFMLAANEAVASRITDSERPVLYRVHDAPAPEKLAQFRQTMQLLGIELPSEEEEIRPIELQQLIAAVAGRPEERLVNEMLLRAMKQARYSEENRGHFGLASVCYTHFTSPIRRYPDLVVHRVLKSLLGGGTVTGTAAASVLAQTAEHTSRRERVAMEAEREIVQLKKLQFMQHRLGEEFGGIICSVSPYGFYVELNEVFVEGMVHLSTLTDDRYQFVEEQLALQGSRNSTIFRIGDQVQVRMAAVNMSRRQLDFELLSHVSSTVLLPLRPVVREEYRREPIRGKRPTGQQGGAAVKKGKGGGRPGSGDASGPGKTEQPGRGGRRGRSGQARRGRR